MWVDPNSRWYYIAFKVQETISIRRAMIAAASVYGIHLGAYLFMRLIWPYRTDVRYPEIDAIKLTQDAQAYWREKTGTDLSNVIIMGDQRSLQAAGTIAFNTRQRLLVRPEQAIPLMRPMIIERIKREGALIINVTRRDATRIPMAESLGPFTVYNAEHHLMPRTRGKPSATEIMFAVAQ